jgi:hypothetical protein
MCSDGAPETVEDPVAAEAPAPDSVAAASPETEPVRVASVTSAGTTSASSRSTRSQSKRLRANEETVSVRVCSSDAKSPKLRSASARAWVEASDCSSVWTFVSFSEIEFWAETIR